MVKDTYQSEVVSLRERVEYLEAELSQHRAADDVEDAGRLMAAFGVTKRMAMAMLAFRTGKVFCRERLEVIMGYEHHQDERNVDSCIKRLRKRCPWIRITTLYGVGYTVTDEALTDLRRRIDEVLNGVQ